MSFKRTLKFLLPLAILCATILSACGGSTGSTSTTPNSNTPVTITIWHGWQGDFLNAKKAIFEAYHKAHPNVTINLVFQNNVVDKTTTAVKANNGPDIVSWADDSLGRFADSGTIVPIDQYVSSDYINSTYSKSAAQAVTFKNKIYGVPDTVEAVTLMYNKKLVSAAELPKTTDELLTFAKTYNQKHPGNYGIAWPTYDPYYNASWFYGFGAYYVKADGSVGLNTAQGIQAAKYIASFKPYMPKQIDPNVTKSLFSDGKAAMVVDGPWSYADYSGKSHLDLGFATLPIVTANNNAPATPFVGVKALYITKNSKNAAVAADVLKFYTNKDNQLQMSEKTGEIPANQAAAQDTAITSNPAIAGYALQASTGVPMPNTPYMSALWKPVQDALTATWTGNQTPEQAMSAAQAAALKGIQDLQS